MKSKKIDNKKSQRKSGVGFNSWKDNNGELFGRRQSSRITGKGGRGQRTIFNRKAN